MSFKRIFVMKLTILLFLYPMLSANALEKRKCYYEIEEVSGGFIPTSKTLKTFATRYQSEDLNIINVAKKSCSSIIQDCSREIELIKKGRSKELPWLQEASISSTLRCSRPELYIGPDGITNCLVDLVGNNAGFEMIQYSFSVDILQLKNLKNLPACLESEKECEEDLNSGINNGKYVEWAICVGSVKNEIIYLD